MRDPGRHELHGLELGLRERAHEQSERHPEYRHGHHHQQGERPRYVDFQYAQPERARDHPAPSAATAKPNANPKTRTSSAIAVGKVPSAPPFRPSGLAT